MRVAKLRPYHRNNRESLSLRKQALIRESNRKTDCSIDEFEQTVGSTRANSNLKNNINIRDKIFRGFVR